MPFQVLQVVMLIVLFLVVLLLVVIPSGSNDFGYSVASCISFS